MKKFFRTIVEQLLLFRARRVLAKKPMLIGVTGSVGKTSTRKAIADVLAAKFRVSSNDANFNTPIGLLLSLLEINTAGSSFKSWVSILYITYTRPLPNPEIIVLEYGVDAPGDMDELLKIATPDVAVLTLVTPVHLGTGQFGSISEIRAEKVKLAFAAKEVIANMYDFETSALIKKEIPQKTKFFGGNEQSDYRFTDTTITDLGLSFRLGEEYFFAPVYGKFQEQVFAPAILLGQQMGVPTKTIKHVISHYSPPAGRGLIFEAINNATIWDFSYNSSPVAARAVLKTLSEIPGFSRKVALLGTMNELGERAAKEHELLGKTAAEVADVILYVGDHGDEFENGVGDKKPLYRFRNAHEVGIFLPGFLDEYDLVLVKGSQNNVFLEAAIEPVLLRKEDAAKLCRRSEKWDEVRRKAFGN